MSVSSVTTSSSRICSGGVAFKVGVSLMEVGELALRSGRGVTGKEMVEGLRLLLNTGCTILMTLAFGGGAVTLDGAD